MLELTGQAGADVAALRDWLAAPAPEELVITTSGSTGEPKRVVLTRDAIVANARASLARIDGPPGAWWLALPSAYVAGVQVIVRSLLSGHEPTLEPAGARYTSLVPTQLARLLDDPDQAAHLARMEAVLLGGGPIPDGLRERAAAVGVRVIATYGASETAGGCVYDGLPLDGCRLRIGEQLRIELAGPMLFDRYDGAPEPTAQTLVDGWYRTSDLGRIEDGVLRVIGRVDDVIVTGGLNVPGPAVAARLAAHPQVRAAQVEGVPDREWGNRVVAFLATDTDLDLAAARDWVAAELPRAWAPREVHCLDELPLLGNGKIDRRALLGMISS